MPIDEPEATSLAVIADAVSSIPAPIKTSFLTAIGDLLGGLTAVPAAWAKRPAQAVEDVTAARSAVAAILAKAVADDAVKDPILIAGSS